MLEYSERGIAMEERQMPKTHKVVFNNRKSGMVTGVIDVISFDLNEVLLQTELGLLTVKGTDLHVNRLNLEKGEVDLAGNVDSFTYSGTSQTTHHEDGFFAKLFK